MTTVIGSNWNRISFFPSELNLFSWLQSRIITLLLYWILCLFVEYYNRRSTLDVDAKEVREKNAKKLWIRHQWNSEEILLSFNSSIFEAIRDFISVCCRQRNKFSTVLKFSTFNFISINNKIKLTRLFVDKISKNWNGSYERSSVSVENSRLKYKMSNR